VLRIDESIGQLLDPAHQTAVAFSHAALANENSPFQALFDGHSRTAILERRDVSEYTFLELFVLTSEKRTVCFVLARIFSVDDL